MRCSLTLIPLLLCLACLPSSAQGTWGGPMPDPAELAERQSRMMTDSLGLSQAQTDRITAVNSAYALKQQELRDNSDGDFKSLREAMRTLSLEQDAELRKYLTSDQWTTWQRIRDREREARMSRYRDRQ